MSLRMKILSGFLILAGMLFAAGALSIYELTKIGDSVQTLLDENYKSINAAKNMIEALEREDSGMLLLFSNEWERGRSTIEAADKDFLAAFRVAKHNITISGESDYIATIMKSYEIYRSLWKQPIAETSKGGDLNWYFKKVHPAFLDAKNEVKRLMSLNDQALYKTASALKTRTRRAIMPGVVAIISALVFTAIFNFFINLYFVSPILKLSKGIRDFIKTGDHSDICVNCSGEIADLAAAIEELSSNRKQAWQD